VAVLFPYRRNRAVFLDRSVIRMHIFPCSAAARAREKFASIKTNYAAATERWRVAVVNNRVGGKTGWQKKKKKKKWKLTKKSISCERSIYHRHDAYGARTCGKNNNNNNNN
jgi:hypothetical protein